MVQCKMRGDSRAFLERNLPAFFECRDLDQALMALDDFIVTHGLDENDNVTKLGHEAQAVYDEIYCCNE